MSEARSFINPQAQSYESLKAETPMSANQRAKFDVLNVHIVDSVVFPGELVIVGDSSTPSCTSHEAYLMGMALGIQRDLELNGAGIDGFFLENFELLQSLISHAATGAGIVSDGWSRYLDEIHKTLKEIEALYQAHLGEGTIRERDAFYASRRRLFKKLEGQLNKMAAYGSGLRNEGSIKRLLELSSRSYLHTGEIRRYAEKLMGVTKAAHWVKQGTYIGVALNVASTGLAIREACILGREDDCRKAKYVQGGSLAGSLGLAGMGGTLGGVVGPTACVAVGIPTGGTATVACAVLGGALGGIVGGNLGGMIGEEFGEVLYEVSQ